MKIQFEEEVQITTIEFSALTTKNKEIKVQRKALEKKSQGNFGFFFSLLKISIRLHSENCICFVIQITQPN